MKRILWISNAPFVGTGYGVQTLLASEQLVKHGYEVKVACNWGLQATPLGLDGIEVLPQTSDSLGQDILLEHVKRLKPNASVLLYDIWPYNNNLLAAIPNLAAYTPVDHDPMPPLVASKLRHVPYQWAMSRFAEEQMRQAGLSPDYIPHMVDTTQYKPLEQAPALIRQGLGLPPSGFLAVSVAANKGYPDRKNLVRLIKAWAHFIKSHPDALLYLHTMPNESTGGVNIEKLLEFYQISPKNVRLPDVYMLNQGRYGTDQLNKLYNAADVFILPSAGEGFGVPVLDAQAAGCPVIVSDFTAQRELGEFGYRIPLNPLDDLLATPHNSEQALPKVSAIIKGLEWAWERQGNLTLRQQARAFALDYDVNLVWERYLGPTIERMTHVSPQPIATSNKRVSIVTPWRDHPELIADYEAAAEGAEVIIIDNASSPENSALIHAMVERLGGLYIKNEANRWFAEANNQGLALASGDVVLFMNNDIQATKAAWLKQVAACPENVLIGQTKLLREVGGLGLPYLEGFCLAATRQTWDKLGGWDAETYQGMYWEDNALCAKALSLGMRLEQRDLGIIHLSNTTSKAQMGAYANSRTNEKRFKAQARAWFNLPPTDLSQVVLAFAFQNEAGWLKLHLPIWKAAGLPMLALDGGSHLDDSRAFVESLGIPVIDRAFDWHFSNHINYLIKAAEERGYKALIRLDPDELMFPDDLRDSAEAILNGPADALMLGRIQHIKDRAHYRPTPEAIPDPQWRVLRLGQGQYYQNQVHEGLTLTGSYGNLPFNIHHYGDTEPLALRTMAYYNYNERLAKGLPPVPDYEAVPPEHRLDPAIFWEGVMLYPEAQPLDPLLVGVHAPFEEAA